jgi:ketosteroid isomerase-like protein
MPEEFTTELEEKLRRLDEAGNRRDWDAALAFYSEDAVVDMSPGGAGRFEGRETIRGLFEDWIGSYEEFEQDLEEVRDLASIRQ